MGQMDKLKKIEKIYKEIAKEDARLNKDFLSLSLEAEPAKKKSRSVLSLGGIAKGRKIEVGSERKYTKKKVSKRIAKEGIKDR